jgi:Fe-S cluster assembly scaffold protein SufB
MKWSRIGRCSTSRRSTIRSSTSITPADEIQGEAEIARREVDPELLRTYEKLGIPLKEQAILAGVEGAGEGGGRGRKVAVDAVFDSVSVGTTFKEELGRAGVIFCSISEAVQEHPELVKKYLGSVVPTSDNYLRR